MKCGLCDKELKEGEQVCEIRNGTLNRDTFGGIGFDEAKSCSLLGYVHIVCLFERGDEYGKM